MLERSVIPNLLHKNKQILVDTAFSPVHYRPYGAAAPPPADDSDVCVLVTQWPLEVAPRPPAGPPRSLSPAAASMARDGVRERER